MSRPVATVSVDMDPVDIHLEGYGHRGLAPDAAIWTLALPRLRERFAHFGIRATFFVVARDAGDQAAALRALEQAGHEVASHSLTHPAGLTRLPGDRLEQELAESRSLIGRASGGEVAGFRAPSFDLDRRVLAAAAAAGYRYDASAYPSPLLAVARLVLAAKSRDAGAALALTLWPPTLRRAPDVLRVRGNELVEFPVAVTPWLRLPVYHTVRFVTPEQSFRRRIDGFAARGEALSYTLHAVDALGLEEDRLDARLRVHPGMTLSLPRKLAALDDVLEHLARRFEPRTFRERLAA